MLAGVAAAAPLAGWDIAVDTGAITAFGTAGDASGNAWVALGWPDNKLQVFRSTDKGSSWRSAFWFGLDGPVRQFELLCPTADPGRLFVFFLSAAGAGDLWLCRVNTADFTWDTLPVAVGADTVDDFAAAADHDSLYYLYCLYVNEHRAGLTGRFTRSLDQGAGWESPLDWWNAWDPALSCGRGSAVHCAWRYAVNGSEIHYSLNPRYGQPSRWQPLQVLRSGAGPCRDPVVLAADTATEYGYPVWACYTIGRRGEELRNIEYAWSRDGGYNWARRETLGGRYVDAWSPSLALDPAGSGGFVDLCFRVREWRETGPARVAWRSVHVADPAFWSAPVLLDDGAAEPDSEGVRPRMAFAGSHVPRGPLVAFSRTRDGGPEGVYLDAPWRPFPDRPEAAGVTCSPNPVRAGTTVRFLAPSLGTGELLICDAAGRAVRTIAGPPEWDGRDSRGRMVPAGAYFVRCRNAGVRPGRLVLSR